MIVFVVSLILVVLLWGWLFVDCIRRRQFTPLLGSETLARVLWLASFLLFNPILLAAYVAFVRFRVLAKKPKARDWAVLVLFGASLWLQLGTGRGDDAENWRRDSLASLSLSAHFGSNGSSMGSGTHGASRPIALDHVRVVYGDHPLLAAIARSFARALDAKQITDRIECWPASRRVEPGALAPDFYVQIHGSGLSEIPTPCYQRFSGTVTVTADIRPANVGATGSDRGLLELGGADFGGEFEFTFQRFGFVIGDDYYGQPASPVAAWLTRSIVEELARLSSERGRLPAISGQYAFAEATLPAIVAGLNLEPLDVECARFVHNRSTWRLHDERGAEELFDALRPTLAAEGWGSLGPSGFEGERAALRLQRGAERLLIGRWPPIPRNDSRVDFTVTLDQDGKAQMQRKEPELGPLPPFSVLYEQRFSRAEMLALRDSVCVEGADAAVWMAFERVLDDDSVGLRDALRRQPGGPNAKRWLKLTNLELNSGERELAESAVGVALALVKTTQVDRKVRKDVEELAAEMGVAFEELELGLVLARAGMLHVSDEEVATAEVQIGETVYAFAVNERGDNAVVVARLRVNGESDAPVIDFAVSSRGAKMSGEDGAPAKIGDRFEFTDIPAMSGEQFRVALVPLVERRFRIEVTGR